MPKRIYVAIILGVLMGFAGVGMVDPPYPEVLENFICPVANSSFCSLFYDNGCCRLGTDLDGTPTWVEPHTLYRDCQWSSSDYCLLQGGNLVTCSGMVDPIV
jgi:hypothetical protein